MDARLTEDQLMFQSTVSAYLRNRYSDAERRRIIETDAGWSPAHWRAFAMELGLFGVAFAEDRGGLGGGAAEHAIIMEQFGTALVAEPYLATAVIGGGFIKYGATPQAPGLIDQLIAGKLVMAYAHGEPGTRYNPAHVTTTARRENGGYVLDGRKSVVLGAPGATHLIVVARSAGQPRDAAGISVFLVDATAAGISRRDYKTISGTPASDIDFKGVAVPADTLLAPEGDALPLIERVVDEATAVLCAEAVGVMTRLHGDTLGYLRDRNQFGRPLAGFQALQHRLVDMLIARQHASSITERAIATLDAPAEARAAAVSAAKVYVGKSIRFLGQNAIQLHGGMGMTDDLAIGFFFKRAVEIERQFGNIDYHLTRYERVAHGFARAA